MRKATLICTALLLLVAAPLIAQESSGAQPAPKASDPLAHYYHLQFVVQEMNEQGKPTNSRTFTTTVSTADTSELARIRTGSRIPVVSGSFQSGPDNKTLTNTQYQYMDIGVNIDVQRTREVGRQLALYLHAEVSSLAPNPDSELHQPIVRQNRWEANVLIPVGKPTVVFSSDTLESKGSIQIVVTATPLP
jgi:hypothetical protein